MPPSPVRDRAAATTTTTTYCIVAQQIKLLRKYITKYGFKSIRNYDLNINTPGKAIYNSLLQV